MTNEGYSPVGIDPDRPVWAQRADADAPAQRFTAAAPPGAPAPDTRFGPPAGGQFNPGPDTRFGSPPTPELGQGFVAAEPADGWPGPPAEPDADQSGEPAFDGGLGDPGFDDSDLDEEEQPEGLDMRVLVEWVDTHIASIVARKVPTTGGYPRWCRQWWYHAEAIVRFESLRHAWMDLIGRPGTAKLSYFRDFLDPTLMTLMADDGPFGRCTPSKHIDHEPLGQDTAPPELFD